MYNKFLKAISIFAIMLLGISLSACGRKETTEVEEKDPYVYTASFERVKFEGVNGTPTAYTLANNKLYALYYIYNPVTYNTEGVKLYIKDLTTKEVECKDITDLSSDSYIGGIQVLSDETIKAVGYEYTDNGSTLFAYTISKDGHLTDSFNVTEALSKSGVSIDYTQYTKFTDDGKLFITTDSNVYVFEGGKLLFTESVQTWINSMFTVGNKAYIATYDPENYQAVVKEIDVENKCLKDGYKNIISNGSITAGKEGHLLVSSDNALYDYDCSTQEKTLLWKWLDLDISNNDISSLVSCGDDTYKMFLMEWDDNDYTMEVATFKKELASAGGKKTLNYGCFYLDYYIKQDIIKFNKTNPNYRISVTEYQNEGSEYQAALDKFNMDVANGKFDIVDVSAIDGKKYASMGSFADLYELINNDAEIDLKDYNEKVIKAYETDGKLYLIAPSFSVSTIITSKKIGESIGEWNTEALIKLREQYKYKDFVSYPSKKSVFFGFLNYSMGMFIDNETGKCNFNSDEFIKVLEFANSFTDEEIDYNDYDEWGKIKSGDIILEQINISSIEALSIYSELFENGAYVLGYPTAEGGKSYISSDSVLAIGKKSDVKEGAWEFIKYLLSEESQLKHKYSGFPILSSAFNDIIKEEMTEESYVDESGVVQRISKGSWGNGFTTVEYYGASEYDLSQLNRIFDNLVVGTSSDEQIWSIIMEESDAFLQGQKSAAEVAGIIQNRVTLFLAEKN